MSEPSFQYDIFLSHNRAQKDWTRILARRLRDDNFKVWFDEWELNRFAGANWIQLLKEGVKASRKVALILSSEFFANEWPQFETSIIQLADAVGLQQRVIPLLHTTCDVPDDWKFRHQLDFIGCVHNSIEFEFRYQQLVYNLDNTRPFEPDFERFKAMKQPSIHSESSLANNPLPHMPNLNTEDKSRNRWDEQADQILQKHSQARKIATMTLFICLIIGVSFLAGYLIHGKVVSSTPTPVRSVAEQALLDVNNEILSLRKEYQNLRNSTDTDNGRRDVNMRARHLADRVSKITDADLGAAMQIFKYEHLCYVRAIATGTEIDSDERFNAAQKTLEACHAANDLVKKVNRLNPSDKKTQSAQDWIVRDDAESRISRLSAVALCARSQLKHNQDDAIEARTIIKHLPDHYLVSETPEKTPELLPCLND